MNSAKSIQKQAFLALFSARALRAALSLLITVCAVTSAHAATTFAPYTRFPKPAPGAFVVSGTGLPDGRLLVWNGANLYTQFTAGADQFERIANGYSGDTAFVALAPDGHTVLLGQGFAGDLILFDAAAPADYSPASVVANIPGHYAGVFLNSHLVLLDVGRLDFSGSELQIIDLDAAKGGAKSAPRMAITKGAAYMNGDAKNLGVEKPPFAYSASIAVDTVQDIVYAMDGNTRELRFFSTAALIGAFNTNSPLDWATDGTLVGSAGQFFSAGVAGVRPDGSLVIGGSAGFLQPGGIQIVDPSLGDPVNASVHETLDPAGTSEFYYALYNAYTDVISALVFDGTAYGPDDSFVAVPLAGGAALAGLTAGLAVLGARRLRKK